MDETMTEIQLKLADAILNFGLIRFDKTDVDSLVKLYLENIISFPSAMRIALDAAEAKMVDLGLTLGRFDYLADSAEESASFVASLSYRFEKGQISVHTSADTSNSRWQIQSRKSAPIKVFGVLKEDSRICLWANQDEDIFHAFDVLHQLNARIFRNIFVLVGQQSSKDWKGVIYQIQPVLEFNELIDYYRDSGKITRDMARLVRVFFNGNKIQSI